MKRKTRGGLEKVTGKQFAGVGTGFDMDSSAFFFGDLNTWGAYPTLPTISQRPRVQVFYMVRNWSERNCFIKTIKTLRHAIYNYGFKVTGGRGASHAGGEHDRVLAAGLQLRPRAASQLQ
jgi:hypothetical protein